jgi:folate-dependent phosphoribosylglycinamide formyltransferase PurN
MAKKVLYKPNGDPLRVVALFSGGASGAYDLLKNPDDSYGIVGAICKSADAKGIAKLGKEFAIPIVVYDIHPHYKVAGKKIKDMEERERYDSELERFLKVMEPDVLIGSGDMYITTWHGKYFILNVHPADLNITDANGRRKYTGDHAVLDAILDGQNRTRSTVHLMTGEVDGGPILVRSGPLLIQETVRDARFMISSASENPARLISRINKSKQGRAFLNTKPADMSNELFDNTAAELNMDKQLLYNANTLFNYINDHQSAMKAACDTPAFENALDFVAKNGLVIDEKNVLYTFDGKELPKGGIVLPSIWD